MKEFIAKKNSDKRLYKEIRKNYKRWTYGNIGMLVCIGAMVYLFKWVMEGSGMGVTSEVFVVSMSLSFIPLIVGIICRAFAISGGREVLMNRISDKIVLSEDCLYMEYIPCTREIVGFDYIRYCIRYSDIKSLDYQEKKRRIKITGPYQISQYRQINLGDIEGNVEVEYVDGHPFYIYAHYNSFDECLSQIYKKCGRLLKEE